MPLLSAAPPRDGGDMTKRPRLKSAQRFAVLLALADVVAISLLLGEAVIAFTLRRDLGASGGARSRLFLATTLRPTLLLTIAGLSYLNVVQGRAFGLGKADCFIWMPCLALCGLAAGLAAWPRASVAATWAGLSAWISLEAALGALSFNRGYPDRGRSDSEDAPPPSRRLLRPTALRHPPGPSTRARSRSHRRVVGCPYLQADEPTIRLSSGYVDSVGLLRAVDREVHRFACSRRLADSRQPRPSVDKPFPAFLRDRSVQPFSDTRVPAIPARPVYDFFPLLAPAGSSCRGRRPRGDHSRALSRSG